MPRMHLFYIAFLVILVVSLFLGHWLPWWYGAVIGFLLTAFAGYNWTSSFWSPFAGAAFAWALHAFLIHLESAGRLTGPMTELLSMPHPFLVFLATAFVGGLATGLGGVTGYSLKKLVRAN